MSYNLFKGTELDNILWQTFKVLPTVYEDALSYLEQVCKLVQHVNEDRESINLITEAVEAFQLYVIGELSKTDSKIVTEVTTIINSYVTDGTIANLINDIIFGEINQKINGITEVVTTNKTNIENLLNNTKTDLQNDYTEKINIITDNLNSLSTNLDTLNYKKPNITLSISPSSRIYNDGETINGVMLNTTLVFGNKSLLTIKYYKNGILIGTKNNNILINDAFLDGNIITNDTSYYVVIDDGITQVQSNDIDITFVTNFYTGVIGDVSISENLIKSLEIIKLPKTDNQKSYILNDEKIIYCYPQYYGNLKSIIDSEGFNVIGSFVVSSINLTLNNKIISYQIYTTEFPTLDNVTLNFEF